MAWYNASWTYRQKITMNATLIDEVFSVLPIAGSELGADFFDDAKSDGGDIRFTMADGTTELAGYILSHDAGTDTGRYFVDVSAISNISTDVDFYIYYGNAGASMPAATDTYGQYNVFPADIPIFYPLCGASPLNNAAQNAYHLTASGSPTTSTNSPVEGVQSYLFSGSAQYLYSSTTPTTTWPVAISAWFNSDSVTLTQTISAMANTGYADNYAVLEAAGSVAGDYVRFRAYGDGGSERIAASTAAYTADTWLYGQGGHNQSIGYARISGANTGTQINDPVDGAFSTVSVAVARRSSLTNYFDGEIALVEFSNVARSSNYVQTIYNAWTNASFLAVTAQETDTTGITGDGALTLPAPLTLAGAGTVLVSGTGALSLPEMTIAGVAGAVASGTGALPFPAMTLAGAGTVLITGSGALALPAPLEVDGAYAATPGGEGNCGFPQLVLSGAGHVLVGGTGNLNLTKLRTSGSGSPRVSGTGNLNLHVLEVAGSNEPPVTTTGWFLFQNATGWGADSDEALTEASDFAGYSIIGFNAEERASLPLLIRHPLDISVPPGAVITSIKYRIARFANINGAVIDYSIQPIRHGEAVGSNLAGDDLWTSSTETIEYDVDVSELPWGANDFGSDFGVSITTLRPSGITTSLSRVVTVWGKVDFESVNPIGGSGAIQLPIFTMDSPPIPSTGTGALTLPALSMKAHSYNALCSCCEGYTMRTLLEIRRMLVQQSGHFELVTDAENEDWGDNGADQFIQAGQRFCDDQWQHHKSEAWLYVKMASGESLATFTNARIIKEVWLSKTGGPRTLVERLTLNDIRERYTEATLADETTGTPLYWAPAVLGLAPQQFEETALTFEADGITDYDLIMFGNHYPYKGLYVMPPCDGDYTLEIKAEWQSHEMCDDADVSFWSQYPELLLLAARREMEIHLHRNTTGAQDFERPLLHSLQRLYHNLVAEESSGPTKIRRG